MGIHYVGQILVAAIVVTSLAVPATVAAEPVEEVIVTARKREETLFQIPISVTALSEKTLFDADIVNLIDIAKISPGLYYESYMSGAGRLESNPTFRGIVVNTVQPTRMTASVFVDGAYVAGGFPSVSPSSIERVEVIRGPQAAVFGRTTFAGAVNYVLRTPSDELSGSVTATAETKDEYRLEGSVEGSMVPDVLSGRLSALYHSKDGQYTSQADGARLGDEDTVDINGMLYLTLGEIWKSKLGLNYVDMDDGPAAITFAGLNDTNCGPFPPGTTRWFCGDVPINPTSVNVATVPDALKQTLAAIQPIVGGFRDEFGLDREVVRVTWNNSWDIPGSSLAIDAITAFNREDVNYLADADASGDDAWVIAAQRRFQDFSQELRASGSSSDDRLLWMVGANYLSLDYKSHLNQTISVPPIPALNLPAYSNFGNNLASKEEIETLGLFGSIRYYVVKNISLGFEGRYQKDDVKAIPGGSASSMSESFTNFLPRLTADWEISDETMLYASYSEGNLPGGFNAALSSLNANQLAELAVLNPSVKRAYDEERLIQYEIGLRNRLFEDRLTSHLALYRMDRKDEIYRQTYILTSGPRPAVANAFSNAGKTEIWGFELEGQYKITDIVSVGATLTWTDSELKKYESTDYNATFGTPDAAGQRSPLFPEWMGSVSLSLDKPIRGDLSVFGRVDWFYTGDRYLSEANLATLPAANDVNLRGGISTDRYRLEAFVTNLLDEDAPTGGDRYLDLSFATPQLNFTTPGATTAPRDKRQYGLRATFYF